MDQYDRIDAELYDCYSLGVPGDVSFYVEEARAAGSPVLELACGTGRITLPIAQAGVDIVGLDYSEDMLAVARKKLAAVPESARRHVRLLQGDMRSFSLAQRFKLIAIPYRAFLHMLSVEDQKAALQCCRQHLADDGRLVINQFDPLLSILAGSSGLLCRQGEFAHPRSGGKVVIWESRRYDPASQLLDQYFIFEELDAAGQVLSKTFTPVKLRWVYRYEMQHLFELCGFKVEALYGDFKRGAFRYGGEQIWVARKA